jgi:hypothetical protein
MDAKRSSGGSSSGEGPLIALGGSPLGIGTDGLGSVRIPASFAGIVGFRVLFIRCFSLLLINLRLCKFLSKQIYILFGINVVIIV